MVPGHPAPTTDAPRSYADYRRRKLCEEAARIMADQGLRDFHSAKEKACARLGIPWNQAWLPSNKEIEQALKLRLKLFHGEQVQLRATAMLELALELMELLDRFRPRLAGALVRGNLSQRTPVELHLFADEPESIAWYLNEQSIPYDCFDKRFRMRASHYAQIPGFRFFADDTPVELLAFHAKGERQAPLCPVAGRPMVRASAQRVRELLEQGLE